MVTGNQENLLLVVLAVPVPKILSSIIHVSKNAVDHSSIDGGCGGGGFLLDARIETYKVNKHTFNKIVIL